MATNVREMLIREEGSIPYAYKDSLGYLTIGVGRLIDKAKGGGLSDDEISYLLDNDIKRIRYELAVQLPWVDQLDEPRLAVLIGMAFQMGMDGLLKFVNTLACVRYGHYEDAANGMQASLWAKQTPERAARMAAQMRFGEWK